MTINEIFNQLLLGNGSIITSENIRFLNNRAMELYNSEELNQNQIQELKELLMSCNILYNRTDLSLLPIEDGFYDLLLEKYKKYDSHFQVGSQIVELRNLIENDLENPKKIAESPIIFEKPVERNEVREYMRREIMRIGKPSAIDKYGYSESPIEYIHSPIYADGFGELWLAYPEERRTRRAEAEQLYDAAINHGATQEAIMAALNAAKQSMSWRMDDGQFIPGIVTWLQKETWREFVKPAEHQEVIKWTSR